MMVNEGRDFFCSELVAKAFKVLGIIENDKTSCTKFKPGSFDSKNDYFLKLNPGTTIDKE